MILFKEDWDKYPEAIWDLNTRNTSFLDYSILLRDMGVENHLWPLQLHDPMPVMRPYVSTTNGRTAVAELLYVPAVTPDAGNNVDNSVPVVILLALDA
jgi:hypothetical protein